MLPFASKICVADRILCYTIVNDIRNFVFGLAGASVYGSCKSRKQNFVMSFTIRHGIYSGGKGYRLRISVTSPENLRYR